jgi:hypothetical protein
VLFSFRCLLLGHRRHATAMSIQYVHSHESCARCGQLVAGFFDANDPRRSFRAPRGSCCRPRWWSL